MSILVYTDCVVTISGNDVSNHVTSATLTYNADLQESTAMGDTTHKRIGGLKDWKLDLELEQDFGSSSIDSILFPLVGTAFTVTIKPTSSSVSSTNPNFSGTGILEGYSPISGKVGDLAKTSVSIMSAGTLSRLTT